jgi:Flp pilus assembly protein TadD
MEEGELAKAGTRLAELLQRSPNNANGLNLLGVVDA